MPICQTEVYVEWILEEFILFLLALKWSPKKEHFPVLKQKTSSNFAVKFSEKNNRLFSFYLMNNLFQIFVLFNMWQCNLKNLIVWSFEKGQKQPKNVAESSPFFIFKSRQWKLKLHCNRNNSIYSIHYLYGIIN